MAVKRVRAQKQHVTPLAPMRNATAARVELPEPRRSFSARGIAAVLAPVLRPAFRKRAPAAAQLLADWPMLAGPELAARAAPVKFAAGTLTLACAGPVAMELQMRAPALIQRLNLGLGSAMVERLRFVQQPAGPRANAPAPLRRPAECIAPPVDLPAGALGGALARLYQGIRSRN